MKYYVFLIGSLLGLSDLYAFSLRAPASTATNQTLQQSSFAVSNSSASGTSQNQLPTSLVISQPSSKNTGGTAKTLSIQGISKNVPTIYTDPKFNEIQTTVNQVSQSIRALVGLFKQVQKQNNIVTFAVKNNQSGASTTLPVNTTTQPVASSTSTFDYAGNYQKFQNNISGQSGSYIAALQDTFTVYQNVLPAFQQYMANSGQAATTVSQNYFTRAPFQKNSYLLSLVQSIANSMIGYLTVRSSLITAANYTDNTGASDLFGSTGAFQYCDTVIATIQSFLDGKFAAVSALSGISSSDVSLLQSNYQSILAVYAQKKNMLVMKTVNALLQTLVQKNPVSLVGASAGATPVNVNVLENYMSAFTTAAQFFAAQNASQSIASASMASSGSSAPSPNFLGNYATASAVSAATETMMAQLYAFNGKILAVTIEQSLQTSSSLP